MAFVLALDEGTTSARAIVFHESGRVQATAQKEFRQIFPKPGWVEHDPDEIWAAQIGVAVEAMGRAGISPRELAAIGITNQRETTVVWDKKSGQPVANAIVWQDRRTAPECDRLRAAGVDSLVRERTGLVLDAYFSGTKVAWILNNVPGARQRAEAGELAFGTIDSWLVWKLTGGKRHITDVSNASRTLLFDIHRGAWDDDLLKLLGVPREVLPEVCASSEIYATCATDLGLARVPIAGIAGDQQAALFGQACFAPAMTKNTYGTGCFMLQCAGERVPVSRNQLIATVAWKLGNGPTFYALEGSVFIGGAVVQWLRDGLQIIRSSEEVNALAATVPDNGGVYFVPAFAGLGAPHWDSYARGAILGLTRGATAGHLARAALEAIAFQSAELLDAMNADMKATGAANVPELRVDGGASRSDTLMQIQADLLGIPVVRPVNSETTALGAAFLAGLAVGCWKDQADLSRQYVVDRRFEPSGDADRIAKLKADWARAVERSKQWAQ